MLLGCVALLLAVPAVPAEIRFERHVASLLGTLGCSSGSCHGSFQGKGGLRLSLFGDAPERDHRALTRESLGRRINVARPDESLLLLKPAGMVPHEGGRRFAPGSWQYQLLRKWIARGACHTSGEGTVRRLEVFPEEYCFVGPGERIQLRVNAEFADGSREDVARFSDFRIRDETVASVSSVGEVRSLRPGTTAIIITYQGRPVTTHLLVPWPAESGHEYAAKPADNLIDREVLARLGQLHIVPSAPASDGEFLRRLTIDTIGQLPAPAEVRAFLADRDPLKRARKIDELLAHPLHAALWATRLCDITGNNLDVLEGPPDLRPRRARMWHDWFRARIARNVPYDELVHGVLCATSREGQPVDQWLHQELARDRAARQGGPDDYAARPTLDLFWRRETEDAFFPLEQMAELTASAFLGVRIGCAQCHKHPFDRWTQADYRAFANVFGQVTLDSSPEVRAAVADLLAAHPAGPVPRVREVYVSRRPLRRLSDPDTGGPLPARAPGGEPIALEGDARESFFRWLVRPDNPYFARAVVNRVWAHYFGSGLVEPVDNLAAANPPTNPHLLDALARAFTEHRYDLRWLERTLLGSRTYQLSAMPNATNAGDRTNYSHAYPRRLLAEVALDMVNDAVGTTEDFGADARPGARAVEVAPSRPRRREADRVLRLFGRPARAAVCDCERPAEPTLSQTLFLMADGDLRRKIQRGRLPRLLAEKRSDEAILDELFLTALARLPDQAEKQAALKQIEKKRDRLAAYTDILWALLNTREFILNH
jgi:hypothetical protein